MLSKTLEVTNKNSCHCVLILIPKVIDDPFQEKHVEDDREKAQYLTNQVFDSIAAMIFLLNVSHVAHKVILEDFPVFQVINVPQGSCKN